MFEHVLGAQKRDVREWSYVELCDRVDWIEEFLKNKG